MPNPKQYTTFTASEPRVQKRNHFPYTDTNHISLTCPHCVVEFVSIPQDSYASNRTARIKSHLSKCPAYECPPCDEEVLAPSVSALVVHDKCIEREATLKQEKSSLEQKLDKMSAQLTEQKEDMKKQTAEIIGHSDTRWSSFATVMVNKFPTLREPVNDETIPGQMAQREQSLLLKDTSERETMRMRIEELEITNKGLVESQTVLTKKFKDVIDQRDERVDVVQYRRLLDKYDKLKDRLVATQDQKTQPEGNVVKLKQFHTLLQTPTDNPRASSGFGQPSSKRLRPSGAKTNTPANVSQSVNTKVLS